MCPFGAPGGLEVMASMSSIENKKPSNTRLSLASLTKCTSKDAGGLSSFLQTMRGSVELCARSSQSEGMWVYALMTDLKGTRESFQLIS